MSTNPYTPDEEHMSVAWIECDDAAENINDAAAEFDRFIEKVRSDALREAALSGLFGSNAQRTLLHMAGEDTP